MPSSRAVWSLRWTFLGISAYAGAGALSCDAKPTAPVTPVTPVTSDPSDPSAAPSAQAEPGAARSPQAPSGEPSEGQPATKQGSAFSVHEWGVVTYDLSGEAALKTSARRIASSAPSGWGQVGGSTIVGGGSAEGGGIRKPVIYLVPEAGWSWSQAIQVKATLKGAGRLREVWPTPEAGAQPEHGPSFTWSEVRLKPDACAPGWGAKAQDAACASLGQGAECEAAELEAWIPVTTRCLDVQGQPAGALLYNGTPDPPSSPLKALRPGAWRNVSSYPLGPLLIVYQGLAREVPALEPQQEIDLAADAASAQGVDPVAWTERELRRLGLSEPFAADFMRAWRGALESTASKASSAPVWYAFGFLSPTAIEALATLQITPEPAQVTRVLGFMVQASGAWHGTLQSPSRPAGLVISLGKPTVQGGLDREVVMRIVRQHRNKLRVCGERALSEEPVRMQLVAKLSIDAQGQVRVASIEDATLARSAMGMCLAQELRELRFPAPKSAGVTIATLPLTFSR